jgi:hypothetical protein
VTTVPVEGRITGVLWDLIAAIESSTPPLPTLVMLVAACFLLAPLRLFNRKVGSCSLESINSRHHRRDVLAFIVQ